MGLLELISTAVISSLILYNIQKTDEIDRRLDKLSDRLLRLEMLLPKRKEDKHYYSENSGIDL
jgi:hypothetical protein